MDLVVFILVVVGIGLLLNRRNRRYYSTAYDTSKSSNGFETGTVAAAATGVMVGFLLDELMTRYEFDDMAIQQMLTMNFDQLQQFALENDLMTQQDMDLFMQQQDTQQVFDPYVNPGQDVAVDEAYHGMGIANPDTFHNHNDIGNFDGVMHF